MDNRLIETLNHISDALDSLDQTLVLKGAIDEARLRLAILKSRLTVAGRPLCVAICGPTGVGKSYIFNQLAGSAVSPSSYRRPSTMGPVAVYSAPRSEKFLLDPGFLPGRPKESNTGPVTFSGETSVLNLVRLTPANWLPDNLILFDTPDFDSVELGNQKTAQEISAWAEAVILVTDTHKYADQCAWDFLTDLKSTGKKILIVLNRVTGGEISADFTARLTQEGLNYDYLEWPEEKEPGGAPALVTAWLADAAAQSQKLLNQAGAEAATALGRLMADSITGPLLSQDQRLTAQIAAVETLSRDWHDQISDKLTLKLPQEARDSLLNSISDLVYKSDLWATPRRLITMPFTALGRQIKTLMGQKPDEEKPQSILDRLKETRREAFVSALREEGRQLALIIKSPPDEKLEYLNLSPDEIRSCHDALSDHLETWLKEETKKLLANLPLGKKAAFYLMQALHLGLVVGIQVQTGGLPGTEVLVGGALGPVISKITGTVISRETLTQFEAKAAQAHHQELVKVLQEQEGRYLDYFSAAAEARRPARRLADLMDSLMPALAKHKWA